MPFTIFFSSPGTYYIEDDGIRGNNTSVVKDSSGNTLFPFVHPADTIDFTAEVPGINFVFNVADTFGTANVNVGDIASPVGTAPDSIVVKSLQTDAFITLASNGSITEGGSDASPDVTAAGLILSAATGIGTAGNALETQVTFIEGETTSGGINLANFGSVQIGGLTPDVNGLDVVNTGNINFSTTGFILVADGSGGSSIHGGNTSGNVTLSAIGADSDIFTNIDQPAIKAPGGGVTLNAGRDVILGTAGANFNNDVLATGPITINAGRDFQLDGTSDIRTGAFGGVVGGAIGITAGRNINLSNVTGGLQTVQAFQGDVTLTVGPGGTFFENAGFPGAVQTTDDIFLNADTVQINSGGLNTTGIGQIAIRPVTAGRAIDLGTTLDGPVALGLSDDEFDLLFSLNVFVGNSTAGNVTFSAPLTPFIVDNLTVQTGNDILFNSTLALPRTLTLFAGDDIFFAPGAGFASTNESLVAYADNIQGDDGTGGLGDIGGTLTVNTPTLLYGNIDADTLRGSNANDVLDGAGGADFMAGRAGNDTYFVDNAGDVVMENAGEGTDQVFSNVNYTLTAGSEIEQLATTDNAGTVAITFAGNEFANAITGNAGNNALTGGAGNDTLTGLAGNDTLGGNQGNDTLEGGGGNDTLDGGLDSDTTSYVSASSGVTVDLRVTTAQNTVGAGSDTLANIENLSGSNSADTLTGNSIDNVLSGLSGNDTLFGLFGNDTLNGNQGNDTLDGGLGNDTLDGGIDSDTASYAAIGGGVTLDLRIVGAQNTVNAGIDTLLNVENLTGSAFADTLVGNSLANVLTGLDGIDNLIGNFGNDTLNGGVGNDFLYGNQDNDTLNGNQGNDFLDGGLGNDTLDGGLDSDTASYGAAGSGVTVDLRITTAQNTVAAGNDTLLNIENVSGSTFGDTLTGNSGDNVLTGLSGNDVLVGNFGNDTLIGNQDNDTLSGGAGNDLLNGGVGLDTFVFDAPLSAATNVDTITGFSVADDVIALKQTAFVGIGPTGALAASAFFTGAAAHDADDRVIYNSGTGQLFFDADGNGAGAQVLFAQVGGGLALSAADFLVIA